ncbi:MAG: IPT/TIG domain-containing protein, partial [Cyanobacteria bacterium P01_D01_bin.2]
MSVKTCNGAVAQHDHGMVISLLRVLFPIFLVLVIPSKAVYAFQFPNITSVTPNFGPVTGGNTITINGTGFGAIQGDGDVAINGRLCTNYTWSDTQVTCTVPAAATTGEFSLDLLTAGLIISNPVAYTYLGPTQITAIDPTEGPTSGGNTITINGANFGLSQVDGFVQIGSNQCSNYTWSNTQVSCTVPAGTPGDATLSLSIGGVSADSPVPYVYNTFPTITSVSPTEGPTSGGNTITINGSDFGANQNGGSVTIGAFACTDYTWSDTQVTCTVPAGAPGNAPLVLTIGAGFATNTVNYFYNTFPAITSIAPTEGPTAGGNTITINGSDFGANQNGGKVTIGPNDCTDYTWSDTQVTCTVPAGTTGNADVVLTIGAGFSTPPVTYFYNTLPTISSVSPTEGPTAGGNTITINGSAFGATQDGGQVTIGNNACTNYTWSDTQVTCTVPAGITGFADLVLTIGAGFSTVPINYFYNTLPAISSISPTEGPTAGGNTITINGSDFGANQNGGKVTIGFNDCTDYTWSDTQVTCTVPAGVTGNADLVLTIGAGFLTPPVPYLYNTPPAISSISPTEGAASGGNTITINGSNFGATQNGGSVTIGNNACTNYTWSDTQVTCTVPAGTPGSANLVLTIGAGFSSGAITYLYLSDPIITFINPTQGPAAGGNTITISGSNFGAIQGGGSVDIGGNACSNYSWSDTQITCTVPAGNAGNANLNLTTASGVFSNTVTYTYVGVPTITSINPTQGPAAGGNTITISGSNFGAVQGGGNVAIGGNACSNYSWSDTQITCTVPAGNAGNANLNLTTASGTFSNTVTYTYVGVPTITLINPTQGPAAGGNT